MICGTPGADASNKALAPLKRRFISLLYEVLILAAVLLVGALPPVMLTRHWEHATARPLLQAWIVALCGVFYVWQWASKGQTLPMKTWKLWLVAVDGSPVSYPRATGRYIAAIASIGLFGLGYAWALIDRDRQFLHDRLAGTRLVTQA